MKQCGLLLNMIFSVRYITRYYNHCYNRDTQSRNEREYEEMKNRLTGPEKWVNISFECFHTEQYFCNVWKRNV